MDLQKITEYLDKVNELGVPGADCIIYKNHELVYRHMVGTSDKDYKKPIDGSELYLMFSMTKVQTMVAFMQLVEAGKISLEDEVGDYLPSYKKLFVEKEGKVETAENPLKIKYLLSMQSGLDYDLNRPGILRVLKEKGDKATTRELVDSFVESPLIFEPGTHFRYSLSHDVAAAVIEVVSGMSFGEYLRKNIWEPLGMKNTHFAHMMNDDEERLAQQFIVDETGKTVVKEQSCNYQLSNSYESGGAGLISCTEDYAVFADTIACGGISKNGVRIIKPETIELMKQNLLSDVSRNDLSVTMGRSAYGYGCGVSVFLDPEKVNSPAPKGVFGWDGAAGSCITMDTASGISIVYIQHVRNCNVSYNVIHPTLRDLTFGEN